MGNQPRNSCFILLLMQATGARVQLQDAIMKSHGSHTARWLTETAAECLKHGLLSSSTGLQLHPIKYTLVATHLKGVLPEFQDVLGKLQSSTGQKYFRLFWASEQPDTVLLKLRDIILVPGQPLALANLLRSIQIVDRPIAAPVNGEVPPLLLAGVQATTNTSATHRFSVGFAKLQSCAYHALLCLHGKVPFICFFVNNLTYACMKAKRLLRMWCVQARLAFAVCAGVLCLTLCC